MPRPTSPTLLEQASTPWFAPSDLVGIADYGPGDTKMFTPEEEEILLGGNTGLTKSGQWIGAEQALRISTAYACRRVISEDIAKMARRVVRVTYDAKGRERTAVVHDHPVHDLLTVRPNEWMTPFELVQYMVAISTFHEAAYALIQRDRFGNLTELLPLLPGTCAPEVDSRWDVSYRVTGYGMNLLLKPGEIFALRGPMADPWHGHNTILLAKEAVGLAAAIEASQARFHANDLRPSGVLSSTEKIEPAQREKIRQAWQDAYGAGGKGGIAILDAAFKFDAMTVEGAKQEVIENRKFQVSDTCRFFRVFPQIIGHNDGSQAYASVENMFTAHGSHCLQPWAERFEEAATLSMLSEQEIRQGLRVDLDMDAVVRGTTSDRVKIYKDAVTIYMTPNEIRVREGLDPIDDPAMDRVHLAANNTGLKPALGGPLDGGALDPEPGKPRLPPPAPRKPPVWEDEDQRFRSNRAR